MRTPEWNSRKPQMPIDKNGNWISYPGYGQDGWELVEHPFYAELDIDSMQTGRSSKLVILRDTTSGKTYPMFVADMVKGIQHGHFTVAGGTLRGWWTGSKRGANYGIKAVPAESI